MKQIQSNNQTLSSMQGQEIVAATSNIHKFKELKVVTERYGVKLCHPSHVAKEKGLSPIGEILENGNTYRENAFIKAMAYMKWSGMNAIGDDSGLEIPMLDNRPGIYSARYGGVVLSDYDRINVLLDEITNAWKQTGLQDDRAVFKCSLAFVRTDGTVYYADSELWGTVLTQCRGTNGFGYDPIININDLGKTLAEVDFPTTCKHGFRAKAAQQLFANN